MVNKFRKRRNQKPKLSKEEFSGVIKQLNTYLKKLSWKQKIRYLLVQKYGARCKKCGITDYRVLQLDHINGGGELERKKKTNNHIYKRILEGVEPIDKYQLLCANCNWVKKYDNMEVGKKS